MYAYLAIAVAGVFGCWSRYVMTQLIQSIWGSDFPYATLLINISGSFLMGFLFVETLERLTIPVWARTGILTGFIGGYTTFSTFAMETLLLIERGEALKGGLYLLLSNLLGVAAAFFGAFLARNV